MSDAYTVLWTHDTCDALRKAGRTGQRPPVAFSGIHSSLPRWSRARAGGEVYSLHVKKCVLYVVSRMRILNRDRRDCCGTEPETWRDPAFPGHGDWAMLGAGGCGAEAVHVESTPVRFDLPVPADVLERFTYRNLRGRTRGLKFLVDGRLEHSNSIQGFYRVTPDTADDLARLVDESSRALAAAGR